MKNNMKYLFFDIDRTLFDFEKFKKLFENEILSTTGITGSYFKTIIDDYYKTLDSSTDFDPFVLFKNLDISEKNISHIMRLDNPSFRSCIFSDVIPALKKLQRTCDLGIYSEGLQEYQLIKLKWINILNFFDEKNIHIKRRKRFPESLAVLPENSILVDDRIDVLIEARKHRLYPIWINRKSKERDPSIPTVFTLLDIDWSMYD